MTFDEALPGILAHFNGLYEACGSRFNRPCGSYLFNGQSYAYDPGMREKQEKLFGIAKTASTALETGVYMGHSALIMLSANPDLRLTGIDIDPVFPVPAAEYLNRHFGNRIDLITGDSADILPTVNGPFDLIHIDSYHADLELSGEMSHVGRLMADTAWLVIDDWGCFSDGVRNPSRIADILESGVARCPSANAWFRIARKGR